MAAPAAIALLGTGAMGEPIARNLLAAGFELRAWNRTPTRAQPLAEAGATVVRTPAEAGDGADVLLTMLADGPAVAAAADGVLRDGLLWLQLSTVGIRWTERLAAAAADADAVFVDAPVLGSIDRAASGELTVLASGPDDAHEAAAPVFDAIGSATQWLGAAGAGTRLKLVLNSWVLGTTALTAETIALADALGVGGARFLELIAGTFTDSPYGQVKGRKMVAADWEPLFRLELGRKDAALALEAAREAGLEPAVAAAVVEAFSRALERGYGDGDIAAVIEATRPGSA